MRWARTYLGNALNGVARKLLELAVLLHGVDERRHSIILYRHLDLLVAEFGFTTWFFLVGRCEFRCGVEYSNRVHSWVCSTAETALGALRTGAPWTRRRLQQRQASTLSRVESRERVWGFSQFLTDDGSQRRNSSREGREGFLELTAQTTAVSTR